MDSVCSVEGCTGKTVGKGVCRKHYSRLWRTGSTSLPVRVVRSPVCTVEGCERKHHAKGLCGTHYSRLLKYGSPELPEGVEARIRRSPVCTVEGCERKHQAKGFCGKHYQSNRDVDYQEENKKRNQRETCRILRKHEEDMKDDPESLSPTFMRELVLIDTNCDEDGDE